MRHVLVVALFASACSLAFGCAMSAPPQPAAPPPPPAPPLPAAPVAEAEPAPTPVADPTPPPPPSPPTPTPAPATPPATVSHPLPTHCKVDKAEQAACAAKPGHYYIADPDKTCSGGVRRTDEQMKELREANRKQPCVCLDDAEQRRRVRACMIRP